MQVILGSAFFVLVVSSWSGTALAFTAPQTARRSSALAASSSLVVISPPGGVGEVTAVKAASMGASVRWFVVGQSQQTQDQQVVVLAPHALEEIAQAGGQVQLAGASADDLLDASSSAIDAVATWCGTAQAMVCALDAGTSDTKKENTDENSQRWNNAIKVAARQAAGQIKGPKIAILAADDTMASGVGEQEGSKFGGLVGGLFGGGDKVQVPATLATAMGSQQNSNVLLLRHGQLFGTPESSPDFSALTGGPQKEPQLCEEYTMRSIRVDPTVSVSGNIMMGATTRTSRHAVGQAAALLALEKIVVPKDTSSDLDICVTSLRGSDTVSVEEWQTELGRVAAASRSDATAAGGVPLFATEFASVPDVSRLADWLATKWAPAVLRTYDIAAIRVGGRPVYAVRVDTDAAKPQVEIVWQELVNFQSINTGKMILTVSDTGLLATRGPGDASKGYGTVSRAPLAGEDILVRRLAEAASQAIEKGLAKKVRHYYFADVVVCV